MDRLEITIQCRRDDHYPVVAEHLSDRELPVRKQGRLHCGADIESFKERLRPLYPKHYGRLLARALFRDPVGQFYREARARAGADELRVLLIVEPPELASIHWERLRGPNADGDWDFLSLDQHTPYSRYLASGTDHRYPTIGRSALKALVVLADPPEANGLGLARFDAQATGAGLARVLGSIPTDQLGPHVGPDGRADLDAIVAHLTHGQHTILHLVAHGTLHETRDERGDLVAAETILYLTGPGGSLSTVTATELIGRLRTLLRLPHLVFLAVCEGASPEAEAALGALGPRLVRELGIPAVVAMTDPVSVDTALRLAEQFYRLLQDTGHPDSALVRATAGLHRRFDVLVPALFNRLGARRLFTDGPDGPLTDAQIEKGLEELGKALPDHAKVMVDICSSHAKVVRATLGIPDGQLSNADRRARDAALIELDKIADECLEIGFPRLALGHPIPTPERCKPYIGVCPFPGMRPFAKDASKAGDREQEQAFFFGRQNEREALLDLLRGKRCAALLGRSGSGKSSLVLAGLAPDFAKHQLAGRLDRRYMTPGADPLATLEQQLQAPLAPDRDTLLIVDQLEELFTQCTEPALRRAFADRLYAAWQQQPRLYLALTLREEFATDCAALPALGALIQHLKIIPPMATAELRDAIEQQASAVCLRFEDGLSQRILDEVADEPGAMPLLQLLLRKLWERRHGPWLLHKEYDAQIGGIKGVIDAVADGAYKDLGKDNELGTDQERSALIRDIFVRLVSLDPAADAEPPRDTRQRLPMSALIPAGVAPERVQRVIKLFADLGLLTTSASRDRKEKLVEISHEALIGHWGRLRNWINQDRASLIATAAVRQRALDWSLRGEHQAGPPRWSPDLNAFDSRTKGGQYRPTEVERRFLARAKRLRLQTRWVIGATASGLVLAVLGFAAIWISQAARFEAEQRARFREAGLQAMRNAAAKEAGSLAAAHDFARAAASLDAAGEPDVAGNALFGLSFTPFAVLSTIVDHGAVLGHDGGQAGGHLSPNGSRVVTWDEYGDRIRLWSVDGNQPPKDIGSMGHFQVSASFSADGRRLMIWGARRVLVCDGLTGEDCFEKPHVTMPDGMASDPMNPGLAPSLSADGRRLLTRDQSRLHLWDITQGGSEIGAPGPAPRALRAPRLNADGSRILVWDGERYALMHSDTGTLVHTAGLPERGDPAPQDAGLAAAAGPLEIEPVMSPDGTRFVTLGEGGVMVRDSTSGRGTPLELLSAPPADWPAAFQRARFDPSGRYLVLWESRAPKPSAWMFRLGRDNKATVLGSVPAALNAEVALDPVTGLPAFWQADGQGEFWLADGDGFRRLALPQDIQVADIRFTPDGERLVVQDRDGTTRVFLARAELPPRLQSLGRAGGQGPDSSDAAPPDAKCSSGSRWLTIAAGDALRVQALGEDADWRLPLPSNASFDSCVFSGNGRRVLVMLATADSDSSDRRQCFLLWDLDAKRTFQPELDCSRVLCRSFLSFDGKRAFVHEGGPQPLVSYWDSDTGQTGALVLDRAGAGSGSEINPNGREVVRWTFAEPVAFVDLDSGLTRIGGIGDELLPPLDPEGVRAPDSSLWAALNATGSRIVVWTVPGFAETPLPPRFRIYDVASGVPLTPTLALEPNRELTGIGGIRFSDDDSTLIITDSQGDQHTLDLRVADRWPAQEAPCLLQVRSGTESNGDAVRVLNADDWRRKQDAYSRFKQTGDPSFLEECESPVPVRDTDDSDAEVPRNCWQRPRTSALLR